MRMQVYIASKTFGFPATGVHADSIASKTVGSTAACVCRYVAFETFVSSATNVQA